ATRARRRVPEPTVLVAHPVVLLHRRAPDGLHVARIAVPVGLATGELLVAAAAHEAATQVSRRVRELARHAAEVAPLRERAVLQRVRAGLLRPGDNAALELLAAATVGQTALLLRG